MHHRQKPEILCTRFQRHVGNRRKFHRVVCNNLVTDFPFFRVVNEHVNLVDTCVLDLSCFRLGDLFSRLGKHFARFGVDDSVRYLATGQTVGKAKLFVVFVSADLGYVVATGVEEQIEQVGTDGVLRGNFAGTETSIKLD